MGPSTGGNRYNVIEFIVSQILNRDVRVATPVVVLSVSGGGPAGPAEVRHPPAFQGIVGEVAQGRQQEAQAPGLRPQLIAPDGQPGIGPAGLLQGGQAAQGRLGHAQDGGGIAVVFLPEGVRQHAPGLRRAEPGVPPVQLVLAVPFLVGEVEIEQAPLAPRRTPSLEVR